MSGEWGPFPAFTPGAPEAEDENPSVHVPGLDRFYQALHTAWAQRGIITPVPSHVQEFLEKSGAFQDIIQRYPIYLPLGDWCPDPTYNRLGRSHRVVMARFMDSARELLLTSGVTQTELEDMYNQVTVEMHGVPGLVSIYYMVEARRK